MVLRKNKLYITAILTVTAHGIYIKFFRSAKRGRGTVSFTPLRGVASRKALAIMGDVILESTGVFDPTTQTMLGQLWKETSRLLSRCCFSF